MAGDFFTFHKVAIGIAIAIGPYWFFLSSKFLTEPDSSVL